MKKLIITLLTLGLIFSFAFAKQMQPSSERKPIESPAGVRMAATRNVPQFTFSKTPTSIIVNYYDYMVGSYNGLPLRVIPQVAGGGYFMTYHGKREANGTRRSFYTYLDAEGNIKTNSEITNSQNHEGYTTLAIDPVSGKPFYAWHANADTDDELEVQFASDAFMEGYSGLFNDIQIAIDNPSTVLTTNDNEFIWPTAQIGPSPIAGKRRIFLVGRNSESHSVSGNPSENPKIAFADFDENDIELAIPLVWNYTSIPEMDDWNHDLNAWRRPFHAIAADNAGNLYYVGYHFAQDADENDIDEADMDVFKCDNYGEGTWTRVSAYSDFYVDNPPEAPGSEIGYFEDQNNIPFEDGALSIKAMASFSGHSNSVVDGLGRVHTMGIWGLSTNEGSYYPNMQYVKSFIYDPASDEFKINEICPQKDPNDNVNDCFIPWDTEAPFGEPEYIEIEGQYYLDVVTDWPYPHWNSAAHSDAMSFHYNNMKISEANDQGMMVALWQNSWRARQYNEYSDPDYQEYADTPEIWLSVSPDNGDNWSEPIVLNKNENIEMQNIKPMWVYPADKVIFTGMQGDNKVGKIGIMLYNDYTWGSNAIDPPYHVNPDGGEMMFMELQIVFPEGGDTAIDNHTQTPAISLLNQNYPNPFNPSTTISYTMNKAGNANLSIYNVKGQLVNTLVKGKQDFGTHNVVWNGTDANGNIVPSGIYFYRFTTDNHSETKKMMLMK